MSMSEFKVGDIVCLTTNYLWSMRIVAFTRGGDIIVISDIMGLMTVSPDEIEIVPPARKGEDHDNRTAATG